MPDYSLPGFNCLLMGPAGTGKTFSIGTLVETGIEVFYLALESGMESLLGYWADRQKEIPPNLHWHRITAPEASFEAMIQSAKLANTVDLEALAKSRDPNRSKYDQFIKILTALNNFPDDRTGELFGPVNKWDQSRVIVIDSATALATASLANVVGGKPVRSQTDWQIGQNQIEALVRMLCDNCPCHFVLLAHVEREVDQVLGGVKIMVSTLGKALAPKFPSMFSDVILAERSIDKWSWSTANGQADIKTRNLPIKNGIDPNFRQILEKWNSRNGQ